jgi:polysaccharide biosynthesis/export protein
VSINRLSGARRTSKFLSPTSYGVLGLSLTLLAAPLTGCETNGFMDPRQVGRWEHTPTTVPVLERLAVVEGNGASDLSFSATEANRISQDDLIPEVDAYRLGPGDAIEISVQDIFNPQVGERFERTLDPRGFVDLPILPSVHLDGQSAEDAQQTIARGLKAKRVLNDPIVAVNVINRRKLTYNVIGGVTNPGTYTIPRPDYRLLEAVGQAGRFSEQTQFVYVIRGTPLSDAAAGRVRPADQFPGGGINGGSNGGGLRVPVPMPDGNVPTGSGLGGSGLGGSAPANGAKKDTVVDLIDAISQPSSGGQPAPAAGSAPAGAPSPAIAPAVLQPTGDNRMMAPPIDIDAVSRPAPAASTSGTTFNQLQVTDANSMTTSAGGSKWVFVNGQWVSASQAGMTNRGGQSNIASNVLNQRVIAVPMQGLLNGAAQFNVVIRAGDVIRVPAQNEGVFYMGGNVNRPGVYNLPAVGRNITLIRAIDAAGGLNDIAIPERIEILRFVGPDRQAIVRLNLRAIAEGTHPDIFLKDGDRINVGTNFWATPLAVIRNGFRAGYGFSFTLDRNFGFDVFGPQDTNGNVF